MKKCKIHGKYENYTDIPKCPICDYDKTTPKPKLMKKGQIVYFQGVWKCKVIEDYGGIIFYIPLEGYAPCQKGQQFTANKDFFKEKQLKDLKVKRRSS